VTSSPGAFGGGSSSIVVARSSVPLVGLASVGAGFGTFWQELRRRDDGWQLLRLGAPFPHQWPGAGGGVLPVVADTGAPVLAVWVAGTDCATFSAALPPESVWSGHYPDCHGVSDHYEQSTLRLRAGSVPPRTSPESLARALGEWARSTGLPVDPESVAAGGDLVAALGFSGAPVVPPLFDHTEPEWMDVWYRGWRASAQVGGEWSWSQTGLETSRDAAPLPPEAPEMIRFVERVAASMFGNGFSRADLATEAARLTARYPEPEMVEPLPQRRR
jgi:hypothetical protein